MYYFKTDITVLAKVGPSLSIDPLELASPLRRIVLSELNVRSPPFVVRIFILREEGNELRLTENPTIHKCYSKMYLPPNKLVQGYLRNLRTRIN